MMLSHLSSVVRRSPISASHRSASSAATSASGVRATRSPAMPAVGRGAVGAGTGFWEDCLEPHASAVRRPTHHAPHTKYLVLKGLLTRRNLSEREAAVHHDYLSGDVPRRFAAQEEDHTRHILGLRDPAEHRLVL